MNSSIPVPRYSFGGKVALVTGAAGGLGKAVSLHFARAGARVVVSDLGSAAGHAVVEEIRRAGGTATFIPADISHSSDVEAMVSDTVKTYGKLDFACNAAGISIENLSITESDDAIFDRVIATNLRGPYLCLKHEIRQMVRQGTGGAIVNISSLAAFRTRGDTQPAYVASKAGLLGLSRLAAMRYGRDHIRVNAICPGVIDTPMLNESLVRFGIDAGKLGASYGVLGRIGEPAEIAEAVLWLCSDASSYVVGCVLPVDGGELTR